MKKQELSALVKAAQAGREDALGQLYEAFHQDIYYFILKTAGDQELAMDLTQDTFVEIMQTIQKLENPEAFMTWSKQVAYHKCTAYFRKRRELLADEDEDGYSVFETVQEEREEFIPDQALEKEDLRQAILEMVNQLPEEQRSAVLLRYYNEVSVKEIAQIQGVSENTVKSRLNYGRKSIKQAVEDYEKKSGVKLRCAGIVPLLLWLFKEMARAQGVCATTKVAAAFGAAAGGAGAASAAAGATGTATAGGATTAAAGAAKAAGGVLTKKLVAGIAAVAVAGGVTAGVVLSGNEESAKPLSWKGHTELGMKAFLDVHSTWFDLELEYMTDTTIAGSMVIRQEGLERFNLCFDGTGELQDDEDPQTADPILYTLRLDEPVVTDNWITVEHTELEVLYNKDTDTFFCDLLLNTYEDVTLRRTGSVERQVLMEKVVWEGDGKDTNQYSKKNCHIRLEVDQMSNLDLSGTLIASAAEGEYYRTAVTGECIYHNNIYWYHLYFETPREKSEVLGLDYDSFLMLLYRPEENTFGTLDSFNTETFSVTLSLVP